jgi:hypothetical protein
VRACQFEKSQQSFLVLSSYALALYWKCIVDDELNLWSSELGDHQKPFRVPTCDECRRFVILLQDNFIQVAQQTFLFCFAFGISFSSL